MVAFLEIGEAATEVSQGEVRRQSLLGLFCWDRIPGHSVPKALHLRKRFGCQPCGRVGQVCVELSDLEHFGSQAGDFAAKAMREFERSFLGSALVAPIARIGFQRFEAVTYDAISRPALTGL